MHCPEVLIVANGDLRLSANQKCWAAQAKAEEGVANAVRGCGRVVRRAHQYDESKKHGFIDSQRRGIDVFRSISPESPLIVVEAVWQYSQHLMPGLLGRKGPILTVANWSGQFPGLVGLLNLNASLRKAGVQFDTLWSVDFEDSFFVDGLRAWLSGERLRHDQSHVRRAVPSSFGTEAVEVGAAVARQIR